MSTEIRPELSEKNKYWIPKHRYYELKHFCLQYPDWKKVYAALDAWPGETGHIGTGGKAGTLPNPTENLALRRASLFNKMHIVELAAQETDESLALYILLGVTQGCSYTSLRTRLNIPCCRDVYYDLYRKFFWILNRSRN